MKIMNSAEPQNDYLDAALCCVFQIHIEQPEGDVLVFLSGMFSDRLTVRAGRDRISRKAHCFIL